ncbi:site-specific integrase [Mycobacterium sp. M1]|uniref:Site-specific integrase n=1 Tax=Mycolicibacter acidiphilus TaxID=2835306 RepID=A0ABS5RCR5_9MYCO|nr:site-specific integrase [Mycolicibacter acidiphilus]MBS9532081.1 site-specific integrase [Mycolicibacter acidiphilus]
MPPTKTTDTARTRRGFGQLRKRDSGRWAVNYTHNGQLWRAPATFPNKDSATAWLAGERKLIDLGTWTPPADRVAKATAKKLTLRDYAVRWLEQRTNIAPRTRETYYWHLEDNILPVLGDTPVTELTTDDVRAWFAGLGTERETRNARAYGVLTAVLNTAVDDGLIDRSPARIKGASTVKHRRTVVLLEPGELSALADKMPGPLRLAVLLAGWCGLRRGELLALTRADIAADGSTLRINKGVTVVARKMVVGPPKTKESNRTVTVPTHLRPVVIEHLAQYVGPAKTALLFPDPVTGSHYTEGRFRVPFFAARAAIGKEELHFHDLRHFGGVMAAVAGATTKEVMDRLGHTTSTAAMRYQHVAAGRADLLADRLSALAHPPAGGAPTEH